MNKTWNFNGKTYTMSKAHGDGQYILNGYHCTDSSIWDECDNEDEPERMEDAHRAAEAFLATKDYGSTEE